MINKDTRQRQLLDLRRELESKASGRWSKRQGFRKNPLAYLEKNVVERVKMEERYANYNRRESWIAPSSSVKMLESTARTFERKIGDTLDLSRRPPSQAARQFGRPVGRIFQVPDPGFEIDAFGSGFLISPNLLITNYHVLPSASHAEGCAVNFGYEYDEFNKLQLGIRFALSPKTFFLSDEQLDYTIIYVDGVDDLGTSKLDDLGFIPLLSTKGKVILNDPLNIVQYPLGQYKQYSTENNFVKDILEEEGFIQYTTDTLESSSGSPAANKHWEVAALHHSGIAMTVDGKVWSRFNKAWDPTNMTDDDKLYIANEGISISRIVEHLHKVDLKKQSEKDLLKAVLNNSIDRAMEGAGLKETPENTESKGHIEETKLNRIMNSSTGPNVFNFYNTANVQIIHSGNSSEVQPLKPSGEPIAMEKKLRFDETYSSRRSKGYKPDYLGIKIPLPEIAKRRMKEVYCEEQDEPLLLRYYHYSLVMNKKFRLQMWSAVNVDYDPALKTSRERKEFGDESNSWRLDPRIPAEIQITDGEFYKPATQVDRGHIVRRDDSCYGNTELEIEYANSDTFHWTNCTPQHEGFNQSRQYGIWGLLENEIKTGLSGDDTRASIFAGPILVEDEDRVYNGIHYPVKFWKVVAALDEDEGLMTYGFILDQTKVIDKRGLEAKFDFTQFKAQQVMLAKIEGEAGVIFPEVLKNADVLKRSGHTSDSINLESLEDVKLSFKERKKKSKRSGQ